MRLEPRGGVVRDVSAVVLQPPDRDRVAAEVRPHPERAVEPRTSGAHLVVRDLQADVAQRPPRHVVGDPARAVHREQMRDGGEEHVQMEVVRQRIVPCERRGPRRRDRTFAGVARARGTAARAPTTPRASESGSGARPRMPSHACGGTSSFRSTSRAASPVASGNPSGWGPRASSASRRSVGAPRGHPSQSATRSIVRRSGTSQSERSGVEARCGPRSPA